MQGIASSLYFWHIVILPEKKQFPSGSTCLNWIIIVLEMESGRTMKCVWRIKENNYVLHFIIDKFSVEELDLSSTPSYYS